MLLSSVTPKFDPSTPRMDIQNLIASDLAMRLRASQAGCNGAFAQHGGSQQPSEGGQQRGDSGSSSPRSSCNTNRPSMSSNGGHSNSSGSHSGRSSQSPSDTPSSSHTCPDRGGSSPVAESPHRMSGGDSAHRSAARSENRHAARRAPSSAQRPAAPAKSGCTGGGGGDTPPEGPSRKRSWKILLTAELAAEIYAQRPRRGESTGAWAAFPPRLPPWSLSVHVCGCPPGLPCGRIPTHSRTPSSISSGARCV